MDKEPMTELGHQMLQKRLDRLIKVDRPEVIEAIAVARDHGDLSENAEYDAAVDMLSVQVNWQFD